METLINKFRGWGINDKKWVYGGIVYEDVADDLQQYFIVLGRDLAVTNESVGQFIGRIDKNKRDVYVGDWVNCCRYENNEEHLVLIEDIRSLPSELSGSNLNWIEVVGTYFETPDLREKLLKETK